MQQMDKNGEPVSKAARVDEHDGETNEQHDDMGDGKQRKPEREKVVERGGSDKMAEKMGEEICVVR